MCRSLVKWFWRLSPQQVLWKLFLSCPLLPTRSRYQSSFLTATLLWVYRYWAILHISSGTTIIGELLAIDVLHKLTLYFPLHLHYDLSLRWVTHGCLYDWRWRKLSSVKISAKRSSPLFPHPNVPLFFFFFFLRYISQNNLIFLLTSFQPYDNFSPYFNYNFFFFFLLDWRQQQIRKHWAALPYSAPPCSRSTMGGF